MIQNEIEIIKLRAYKGLSAAVANAYMALSLLLFVNTTLILCGLWVGFYLSHLCDSFHIGFGITAAIYIILLVILVVFRDTLMVRPVQNIMIKMYQKQKEEQEKEACENAAKAEEELKSAATAEGNKENEDEKSGRPG